MTEFIVAEVSKNWWQADAEPNAAAADARDQTRLDLLSRKFEHVIETNRRRGYLLHSFQLHRLYVPTPEPHISETIVAVFQRADA